MTTEESVQPEKRSGTKREKPGEGTAIGRRWTPEMAQKRKEIERGVSAKEKQFLIVFVES